MSGWNEALHPRAPKGTPLGGKFTGGGSVGSSSKRHTDLPDLPRDYGFQMERARAANYRKGAFVRTARRKAGLDQYGVGQPAAKAKYEKIMKKGGYR